MSTSKNTSIKIKAPAGYIEGFIDPDFPSVAQFLGIRYAQSPTGRLRWEAPKAAEFQENIGALDFSPSCPQGDDIWPSIYSIDQPEFGSHGPKEEDCLIVCVFAPCDSLGLLEDANLPVIVWVHGGGFEAGGSDTEFENPKRWVARSGKHIDVKVK